MTDQDQDGRTLRREEVYRARQSASEKFGSLWWYFLLRGLLVLVLGLLLVFWPANSVATLLRLVGAFVAIDGLMTIFGQRRTGGSLLDSAPGAVSVLIGAALLLFPAATAKLAFILIGLWVFMSGLGLLMSWWRMPADEPSRGDIRNVAILALLVGAVLFFLPQSGLVAVGWTLAIVVMIVAAVLLFMAVRFRALRNRLRP